MLIKKASFIKILIRCALVNSIYLMYEIFILIFLILPKYILSAVRKEYIVFILYTKLIIKSSKKLC